MIDFNAAFSRHILLRLLLLLGAALGVALLNLEFISEVYFRNQLTSTGLIINGSIAALFLLGMLKLVWILWRYQREERALAAFVEALEAGLSQPAAEIDADTLIHRRYSTVLRLARDNAAINHSALASMLLANEHTRLSFPKFINNILILTGVFGTIVSLSIALVGASDLLSNADELGNMGLVIHGMSTALSTTITAIVCYLFYGYFYLKLTDAQTHLLSGVEQVTAIHLLPSYSHSSDTLLHDVAGLVQSLKEVAAGMHKAQEENSAAAMRLHEVAAELNRRVGPVGEDIDAIKGLLREGFRLPDADGAAADEGER